MILTINSGSSSMKFALFLLRPFEPVDICKRPLFQQV